MSGRWLGDLLVVICVSVVNTEVDLDHWLTVAHCRATCLHQVQLFTSHMSDQDCRTADDCWQCWQTCEVQRSNRYLCRKTDCGQGCQAACRFLSTSHGHKPPVLLTMHEEALALNSSRVWWSTPVPGAVLVYIVMGQDAGRPWSQLCQTLDLSAQLTPTVDKETVRVLAVDWRGLTKVFSPRAESPLARTWTVTRCVGMEDRLGLNYHGRKSLSGGRAWGTSPATLAAAVKTINTWKLKKVSLVHQSVLVLAQISWEPPQLDSSSALYLVSWEVDGGILRGNLVTNSSTVTLSLWVDTVYTVQVTLLSGETDVQSEPLTLDTHLVAITKVQLHKHQTDTHTQILGVAAAGAVFMLATLAFTRRWQHRLSLPNTKLLDDDTDIHNIYRVFPLVFRLASDTTSSPITFSPADD